MSFELNTVQQRIVDNFDTNLIVKSMAGTGKTLTLVHKLKKAVALKKRVLVLIPSSSHEQNIIKQINCDFPEILDNVSIKTYQQFANQLLNFSSDQKVLSPAHQELFIQEFYQEKLSDKINLHQVFETIQLLKQNGMTAESLCEQPESVYYNSSVCEVYLFYSSFLQKKGYLDREDIALSLLEQNHNMPQKMTSLIDDYDLILCDNFEDFTYIQQQTLKPVLNDASQLIIFTNSDQTIQLFNEGEFNHIQYLESEVKDYEILCLKEYYRDHKSIYSTKKQFMGKELFFPENSAKSDEHQEPITYYVAYEEEEELEYVKSRVADIKNTYSYSDIAIIYRTYRQRFYFSKNLRKKGINIRILEDDYYHSRKGVSVLISLLRLLVNNTDDFAMYTLFLHDPSLKNEMAHCRQIMMSKCLTTCKESFLGEKIAQKRNEISQFIRILDAVYHNHDTLGLLEFIIKQDIFTSFMTNMTDNERHEQNEFITLMLKRIKNTSLNLTQFLQDKSLCSCFFYDEEPDHDSVTIMKFEQCKGHQFPVVFVCGVEEGLIPHYSSQFNHIFMRLEKAFILLEFGLCVRKIVYYVGTKTICFW